MHPLFKMLVQNVPHVCSWLWHEVSVTEALKLGWPWLAMSSITQFNDVTNPSDRGDKTDTALKLHPLPFICTLILAPRSRCILLRSGKMTPLTQVDDFLCECVLICVHAIVFWMWYAMWCHCHSSMIVGFFFCLQLRCWLYYDNSWLMGY